jgi:serralysin
VDTFVFARDGTPDHITDFQNGVDRIDIGAWGRIYSSSVLSIFSTATGAEVVYGDERLIITSADGTPLNAANLNDYDFIF